MPNSKRNRKSAKDTDKENRRGKPAMKSDQYRKLADNPSNAPGQSISTADDSSNGIYSRTGKRDDEISNEDTRGGR